MCVNSVCIVASYENQSKVKTLLQLLLSPSGTCTCPQFTSVSAYTCPGSTITYTCAINTSLVIVATTWSGSALQCPGTNNQIVLLQRVSGILQPFTPVSCGSLSAVTTDVTSSCYTSVLTIPAVQALNGTTVMCSDGSNTAILVGSDTVKITSEWCVFLSMWVTCMYVYLFIACNTKLCTTPVWPTTHYHHYRFVGMITF